MPIERAQGEAPQQALAEQFALYVRLAFTYPETNARVARASAALVQLMRDIGTTVTLRFDSRGQQVSIGDLKMTVSGHHTPWLRDCLARTLLSGVSIPARAQTAHFSEFARLLRENYQRAGRAVTFETLWPTGTLRSPLRITPLELRFGPGEIATSTDEDELADLPAGGEGLSPAEQLRLVRLLSTSPQIRDLLDDLQASMSRENAARNRISSSPAALLDEIVQTLPADVARDPERMHQVVAATLTRLHESLEGHVEDSSVTHLELGDLRTTVRALALYFFRAGPSRSPSPEPASMPRAHPGDDLIQDDPDALAGEFDALPRREISGRELAREHDPELLGIVLHACAHASEEDLQPRLRDQLKRLLAEPGPGEVDLLVRYLAPLFDPASPGEREAIEGAERVLEALRQGGLVPLLRGTPLLDVDRVAAAFPRTFLALLDAIPANDPDALALIPEVCARVGRKRLAIARAELAEQGLGLPARSARLLATPSPQVLPLLPVLLSDRGGEPLSARFESIVHFVLRCALPQRDTAVLRLVAPLSRIPLRYVADFCTEGGRVRGHLTDQSRELLRDFVHATRGDATAAARRVAAIRMLAEFDAPDTRTLLERLCSDRFGFLKLRREPRAVRQAAESALAALAHLDEASTAPASVTESRGGSADSPEEAA